MIILMSLLKFMTWYLISRFDLGIPIAVTPTSRYIDQVIDMDVPTALKFIREVRATVLDLAEAGSRPHNTTEMVATIDDLLQQIDLPCLKHPQWCKVASSVPTDSMSPMEQLALMELKMAAAQAKKDSSAGTVKQESAKDPTVIDLTSPDVRQPTTPYFLDPLASCEASKEILEKGPLRVLRMAIYSLLARCVRPNHPHILSSFVEGDVAGLLAAIRTLGQGNVASQIFTHMRWLLTATIATEGLAPYLASFSTTHAFLTTNATGPLIIGPALVMEALLRAADGSPALAVDVALARRDGTTIAKLTSAWTRKSMDPGNSSLGANMALGTRVTPRAPWPLLKVPATTKTLVPWPKDTHPVLPSELPKGVCWMHVRSGKTPCEGGCNFTHDTTLRASYVAGKLVCRNCMKRHTPRHCVPKRAKAHVAVVDSAEDAADGELGACVAGLSGLEDFY
jgi:hypothetical protein